MGQKSRTNDVVAELPNGRIIAMGKDVTVLASGDVGVTVHIPDLREVEYLLQTNFTMDPEVDLANGEGNATINGNVVGLTIYGLSAGTTLTTEMIAIGPA